MSKRGLSVACALALLVTACSSSGGSNDPSLQPVDTPTITAPSDVLTDSPSVTTETPSVATPTAGRATTVKPKRQVPKKSPSPRPPAHATGLPDASAGAPLVCISALEDLRAAGADTLEPHAAPVTKGLTQCRDVAQWVGGLYAVPGALGYSSASELNDETVINDLQTLCAENTRTPTCVDASKRGLLN